MIGAPVRHSLLMKAWARATSCHHDPLDAKPANGSESVASTTGAFTGL